MHLRRFFHQDCSDIRKASSENQMSPLAIQEAVLFNALVDPGNVRQIDPFKAPNTYSALRIHFHRTDARSGAYILHPSSQDYDNLAWTHVASQARRDCYSEGSQLHSRALRRRPRSAFRVLCVCVPVLIVVV